MRVLLQLESYRASCYLYHMVLTHVCTVAQICPAAQITPIFYYVPILSSQMSHLLEPSCGSTRHFQATGIPRRSGGCRASRLFPVPQQQQPLPCSSKKGLRARQSSPALWLQRFSTVASAGSAAAGWVAATSSLDL